MTWSSATRNRGSSLRQAVLPAFSALPNVFPLGSAKCLAGRRLMGLADCGSTFEEFGEEEFHFQRLWGLTLASGAETQLLMEL